MSEGIEDEQGECWDKFNWYLANRVTDAAEKRHLNQVMNAANDQFNVGYEGNTDDDDEMMYDALEAMNTIIRGLAAKYGPTEYD